MKGSFNTVTDLLRKLSPLFFSLIVASAAASLLTGGTATDLLIIISVITLIAFTVPFVLIIHGQKALCENPEEHKLFERLFNMSSQGIIIINSRGEITDLNIKAQSWFYEEKQDIVGKSIYRNIDISLKDNRKFKTIFFNDLGTHFPALIQVRTLSRADGVFFAVFVDDQTEIVQQEDTLKRLASEDPLTGLLNRRSFMSELEREMERSSRTGLSCSLAMIDLDHFKDINDTYGHEFGDEVLKVFSQILRENSRQLDILCRYGGEEFVLLFPHTDLENSLCVLNRVRNQFADHVYSTNIRPTFSSGVVSGTVADSKRSAEDLIKKADRLLYLAKRSGRDRIETESKDKSRLIRVS